MPVLAALVTCLMPAGGQADEVEAGRAVAQQHCARCHVIGDFNPMGGIGSTPSFQLLVNNFDDWEERFRTFHIRLPHQPLVRIDGLPYPDPTVSPPNAAPFEIEFEDIERITAFARTLTTD
jgi:hypothetical protein